MTDKPAAQPLQWQELGDRPADTNHRTRRADIAAAQEATPQPRNFVGIARISQDIKDVLRHSQNWPGMPADQREALEVIATGMAMILNGQANKPVAWTEIAEQAEAIAERVGKLVVARAE